MAGGGTRLTFSDRELFDLAAAWVLLGVAFTILLGGGPTVVTRPDVLSVFALSMVTVGVGFLLHELAHKVVAVRFDQVAEFRADYGMLVLAVGAAIAGFIFAAPGAVHHRGYLTDREHGLIALAGPVTNVVLAAAFAGVWLFAESASLGSFAVDVGLYGLGVNFLLAAFNMLPFGPLDGRTVWSWNKLVFAAVFLPTTGVAAVLLLSVLT